MGGFVGEVNFEVSGDVVDDGVGGGDVWVAGYAVGLEAHAFESGDGFADGEAELDGEAESSAECLAHAAEGGAFFGDLDEDLAGRAVGVEADSEIALVSPDAELVGDRVAGVGERLAGGYHVIGFRLVI